jgi:ligand-binding sensor domain-containing protein
LSFHHLTNADGLLSDQRIYMTEDRLGRIWIASDEGINVFDGYELTSYVKGEGSGILQNFIHEIYCDGNGTIWIAATSGVQYKKNDELKFSVLKDSGSRLKTHHILATRTMATFLLSQGLPVIS